jgi:heptosyltransferase III
MTLPGRQKILLFRLGHLGDTLIALPALHSIRSSFPQAKISLLSNLYPSSERIAPEQVLPKGLVDDWITYESSDAGARPYEMIRLLFVLRRQKFDTLIYLAPRIRPPRDVRRDLFFFRMAGITDVLGHSGFEPLPLAADAALPEVVQEADHLLRRLSLSGIAVPESGQGKMDLEITESEHRQLAAWLAKRVSTDDQSQLVAIGPGSKWPSKVWPEERFVEIGHRLISRGLLPLVFGGAEDGELGTRLIEAWGRGINAAGGLSIRLAAAALSRCHFYVGNDTGTMHLAAAVKTKCIAIMSALDWPGHWNPYGPGHVVIRRSVPCEGCLLKVCETEDMRCLREISTDDVWSACERLIPTCTQTPYADASSEFQCVASQESFN